MSYAFPPELDRLVNERMATGLYTSQEELLVDALRALEELDSRHRELRDEVQRRVAKSGKGLSAPLDVEGIMAAGRRMLSAE
ncbi:MAG TPA: type II toxin-antitoxin system ParD family antitoxin [Pirellulales bacterium]